MNHPIYKILSVEKAGSYTLKLLFDDRMEKIINFEPVLHGELYGALRDERLFDQVKIDPEVHTIVWENGADFDPSLLHDWDKHIGELKIRAKKWELISS